MYMLLFAQSPSPAIDWMAIIWQIVPAILPFIVAYIPGLNNILKMLPRQFWELCVKLVGGTVVWNDPVKMVPIFNASGQIERDEAGHPRYEVQQEKARGLLDNIDLQKWVPIIVIGVAIFFAIRFFSQPKPAPTPAPAPAPAATPQPPAELQSIVAPIKSLAASKPDAALQLAGYWSAGADVIRRDGTILQSTGQLRLAKIRADQLYLQRSPLVASLPGIGAATDAALSQAVGLDDAAITPASRERIAGTFEAIAWALGG